jgi:hypothetical protein
MATYWELPGLQDVYLEDSWVLDVIANPGTVTVELDVVLRETHPFYERPRPGEQYCFRRGGLVFPHVIEVHWTRQGAPAAKDASGERDYGSIDQLESVDGRFRLSGDFGDLEIVSAKPLLRLARVD